MAKAGNDPLYSSNDHTWMTPPWLVDALLQFENRTHFDLDPACTEKNIPAFVHFTQPFYDGASESWDVTMNGDALVFINPEYGTRLKQVWMPKIFKEASAGRRIWALLPARTETEYQHRYGLAKAGFVVFIYQRICFWLDGVPYYVADPKTGSLKEGVAGFPTMLLYYGDDWRAKAAKWQADPPIKGTLMTRLTD